MSLYESALVNRSFAHLEILTIYLRKDRFSKANSKNDATEEFLLLDTTSSVEINLLSRRKKHERSGVVRYGMQDMWGKS